ncbi:MAG TPA: hypothetical protein VNX68_13605, partial [Nitrosopumilaceae archaeon]|nr:hypothetical protein [Nitrosopumilaceae archaeon]
GSKELLNNLLKNEYPILFEGLHTCSLLSHPALKNRFKIFRESNIEHEYYEHLARAEKSIIKKTYFKREVSKLKRFELTVQQADLLLMVSTEDMNYFKKQYPQANVKYLPSFHGNNKLSGKTGKGEYILYHGNLMVPENIIAAEYLIQEVFSKLTFPVKIAGLNPPASLLKYAQPYKHVEIISNPDDETMQYLIANAQVNCLYTQQATGLKLKLLNVLYGGRFCVCNAMIIYGTGLESICEIANSQDEFIEKIKSCFEKEFSNSDIQLRSIVLSSEHDNIKNLRFLIRELSESSG